MGGTSNQEKPSRQSLELSHDTTGLLSKIDYDSCPCVHHCRHRETGRHRLFLLDLNSRRRSPCPNPDCDDLYPLSRSISFPRYASSPRFGITVAGRRLPHLLSHHSTVMMTPRILLSCSAAGVPPRTHSRKEISGLEPPSESPCRWRSAKEGSENGERWHRHTQPLDQAGGQADGEVDGDGQP